MFRTRPTRRLSSAGLLLLAKTIASGERRYWYLSVAAAAVAFATLEVAFILVITLLVTAFVERARLQPDWRFALKSTAVFVATVFVVWPGALLKLSFLKAYFFLAYLSVFRKAPWGEITLADTWKTRLLENPIDWALLALGLIAYFALPKLGVRRLAYPFLIYGALMTLLVLRVATYSPRYELPFLQAFDLFAGFMTGFSDSPAQASLTDSHCGCVVRADRSDGLARHARASPIPGATSSGAAGCDPAVQPRSENFAVPQADLPILHYYFPKAQLRGYRDPEPAPAEITARNYDGVLYPGLPLRLEVRSNPAQSSSRTWPLPRTNP